jgi:hypothetical protein
MTKLVEKALAAVSKLPPEMQDDIARLMLALASEAPALTTDEAEAIAEAEIARGERASPQALQTFWRSHGLRTRLTLHERSATSMR